MPFERTLKLWSDAILHPGAFPNRFSITKDFTRWRRTVSRIGFGHRNARRSRATCRIEFRKCLLWISTRRRESARDILIDHATGVVIGETAVVEDDVSMLHEVTLGGTGKTSGDRHPKVARGVLIGAGAKILGNVEIGEGSKVAAGSVVSDRCSAAHDGGWSARRGRRTADSRATFTGDGSGTRSIKGRDFRKKDPSTDSVRPYPEGSPAIVFRVPVPGPLRRCVKDRA